MANKLTQDERESIIFAVTHNKISQRTIAEIYLTSHTTVQRLLKEYRDFPEKFPGVKRMQEDAMYEDRNVEHVVLATPPMTISEEGHVMDLSKVARTNTGRPVVAHKPIPRYNYVFYAALIAAVAYVGYVLGWSVWQ